MSQTIPTRGPLVEKVPTGLSSSNSGQASLFILGVDPASPGGDASAAVVVEQNGDGKSRVVHLEHGESGSRWCMAHARFEKDTGVAIYIDRRIAKFLCAAAAAERGAEKWTGWPDRAGELRS